MMVISVCLHAGSIGYAKQPLMTGDYVMALFYVSASKPKQDLPFWTSSVIADDMEQSYKIGKERFETENPDLNVDDYTLVATGESVEKSITT
ncbi:hypothetical protein [Methylophilus sp.]|uniref:hypothetical protein n=2 Tax=Methylophilus sp. TaxID=29541 RepID=UPI004035BDAB